MPKSRKFFPPLIPLVMVIILGIVLAFMLERLRELRTAREVFPDLGEVAPFELIDAAGQPFASTNLLGRLWTANVFFTTCTSVCPPLTRNLAELQDAVGLPPFDLVSISVDPEHDTPQVLRVFAGEYGADLGRWHFLTGSMDAVTQASVDALHIGSRDEPVNHSPFVVLVDGGGHIRGYYNGLEAEALSRLGDDLVRLAEGG